MREQTKNPAAQHISAFAERNSGFTLVELMVVVAVISIILLIAIPAYMDYAVRTKVSEGMSIFPGIKNNIGETYSATGRWPTSNQAAGMYIPASYQTSYIDSVTINDSGTVEMVFSIADLGAANTIEFLPTSSGDGVDWICVGGSMAARYRPHVCRE